MKAWGTIAARVALVLVCAALFGAGVWAFGYARGEQDATRMARYQVRTDTLRETIVRLDTVYQRDTLRLWRLLREIDTVVQVESVLVIAGDSSRAAASLQLLRAGLGSCVATLQTCEQRLTAERRLRQLAESTLAAPPGRDPRPRARAFWAGAAAGAATVLLLRR